MENELLKWKEIIDKAFESENKIVIQYSIKYILKEIEDCNTEEEVTINQEECFNQAYEMYPKKIDRITALKIFKKHFKKRIKFEKLIISIKEYKYSEHFSGYVWMNFSTFLNDRWRDWYYKTLQRERDEKTDNELIEKIMEETTMDAEEAYNKCREKELSREEAEKQIERGTGDIAYAAFYMCKDCSSSREWAEKQIERGIGDVAWVAYWMCKDCGSSRKWAEKRIERGTGDIAYAAYRMHRYCGSSREWAEKQIERGTGDIAWVAYRMHRYCGSSREWADKQKNR